ncbi:hypothetical protein QTI05_24065 [Variovorax sp. J22R193]|uniref:hypothetical protein n=1 Tax=Variovorax fucosicus TaxID=3053517 RepID=UPI002575807D|nr:hypothetical protein [Variovorax sp. J22R193]MDM0042135.1 hypothetical protein [Variovorax sp. J22R193]
MTIKQYDPAKGSNQPIGSIIKHFASIGLSKAGIAAKCGMRYSDFLEKLSNPKNAELMMIWELSRADYEALRVGIRHEILINPTENSALRAKIAGDDLRVFEEHAPATRAVRLQVEDARTVLEFEALSQQEQEEIARGHQDDQADVADDESNS